MQLAAIKAKLDGLQAGLSTSQATAEDAYQLERLLHQVSILQPEADCIWSQSALVHHLLTQCSSRRAIHMLFD